MLARRPASGPETFPGRSDTWLRGRLAAAELSSVLIKLEVPSLLDVLIFFVGFNINTLRIDELLLGGNKD